MTDAKETSCRLCLKTITDKSFEVIGNIIRDILDVLLLKLKFDSETKEVICKDCRRKLNMALEFKSTCLNTDNTIIPYVDSKKMLQLDLRDVYMQEKKSNLVCSQKICRLCMHPVESEFRCIREEELGAIEKLTPEMNINIIKYPVVCKPCFDSLCSHNSFLKDCLEAGEKIKSIFDSSAAESQIDTSPLDLFVKTENLDKEFDTNEVEMSIKDESIDIKSEEEETRDAPLQSSDTVPLEKSDCKDAEEDGHKLVNGSANESNTKAKHQLYKNNVYCFKTKFKESFTGHRLVHKDSSQVQMYKCNDCDFETKYKEHIKQHRLRHRQSQIYRCNDCNYETKSKRYIKRHQLKHLSHFHMYRCNDCDYETKYKSYIKVHQLRHKDLLPVPVTVILNQIQEEEYNNINCRVLKRKKDNYFKPPTETKILH